MRIFLLGLALTSSLITINRASAQTMLENHQKFLQCQAILDAAADPIDHELVLLHRSSMANSKNGYISDNIVRDEEVKINLHISQFQDQYWFVHIADPDTCRQQVNQLINYVTTEVTSILNMR